MHRLALITFGTVLVAISGCGAVEKSQTAEYRQFVQQVEYPDGCTASPMIDPSQLAAPPTLSNYENLTPWPMTLNEAIHTALNNSEVMRDLGGRVLTAPTSVSTTFDPALQETNTLSGVEAALSQFDAQLATGLVFNRNENKFNNLFFGGGAAALGSNTAGFDLGINKRAATGTQFAVRNSTNYNRNNSPVNRFHSVYDTLFQAEVRHPLLQGAGLEFNRIAGPNSVPGVYNGVLVARINNDITLAQFETAVRDLCYNVERTYWQLYQAYRELDTRKRARHAAGLIWREEKLRLDAGQSRPDDEALTRQRYYGFQTQVENTLTGNDQTVGVFSTERALRRLLGLPPADGQMIRPSTPPTSAHVVFDWRAASLEALQRRVELRQQRWLVRRRELEMRAAHNYSKARLDFVGQYGWKGFGDQLLGNRGVAEGSAFADLFGGDLQDWQLGLELTTPVGNRLGHAAVRNAQLQLARERAIQRDQEQAVTHELASALAEMERALASVRSTSNSRAAAMEQIRAIRARAGETERVFFLLDAQQRAADAESALHRAVTDYNVSLLDVEYRRGTLLSYMDVTLAEGGWSSAAHASAARQMRRFAPRNDNRVSADHIKVSHGAFPQQRPLDIISDAEEVTPFNLEIAPIVPSNPLPAPHGDDPEAPPTAPGGIPPNGGVSSRLRTSVLQSTPMPMPPPSQTKGQTESPNKSQNQRPIERPPSSDSRQASLIPDQFGNARGVANIDHQTPAVFPAQPAASMAPAMPSAVSLPPTMHRLSSPPPRPQAGMHPVDAMDYSLTPDAAH